MIAEQLHCFFDNEQEGGTAMKKQIAVNDKIVLRK